MTHSKLKTGYLALAWVNTIATSYFFNYLFFYLRDRFGFKDDNNLLISALYGFIYMFAAWQCGKFAERRGYGLSLKLGFALLTVTMIIGGFLDVWDAGLDSGQRHLSTIAMIVLIAVYSVVLLLTWPALEALISERETQAGTQRMVGVYNCTWAGAGAVANFTGGRLYDGLHHVAIFWIPAALFAAQFIFTLWLDKHHAAVLAKTPVPPRESQHTPEAAAFQQSVSPQTFLKMAWLANPFAYIAINTLLAVMPGIADRFKLSTTQAGLFGSVWFFSRVGAFAVLWKWKGWHYRFRWLLGSFLVLIGSFATVLLSPTLWVVVVAQIFFGMAIGLIYYSSLFYSMDVGETKGEHGGLHEAFIGLGIFLGPGTGAAALHFAPNHPNAGTWAVSALLVCGLGGLLWLRFKTPHTKHQTPKNPQ